MSNQGGATKFTSETAKAAVAKAGGGAVKNAQMLAGKRKGSSGKSSSQWRKTVESVALWVFKTAPRVRVRHRLVKLVSKDGSGKWVKETYEEVTPPKCPSEAHRMLMLVKIADPLAFFKDVVRPMLPAPPKVEEDKKPATEKEILGGTLETLRAYLASGTAQTSGAAAGIPRGAEGDTGERGAPGQDVPCGAGVSGEPK